MPSSELAPETCLLKYMLKPGTVVHTYHPSYSGKHNQKYHSADQLQHKVGPYLKNNQHKLGAGGSRL
jgi:hypothetical protein